MSKGPGLNSGDVLNFPDFTQAVVLSSGVGAAFDTPTGMGFVAFAMNQDFWVTYGSTAAAVPSTSSTSGSTNSELNPTMRRIGSTASTTGISLVSDSPAKGSLNWYKPA